MMAQMLLRMLFFFIVNSTHASCKLQRSSFVGKMLSVNANCKDVRKTSSQLENMRSKIGPISAGRMCAIWEVALIIT